MKRRVFFFPLLPVLTLFCIGLLVCQAEDQPIKTLRVATYNTGHFNQGQLGGYQAEDVQPALQRWKTWITDQKLDLFLIQEWNSTFDKDKTIDATDALLKPIFKSVEFGTENRYIHNGIATHETISNKRIVLLTNKQYYITQVDWKIGDITVVLMSVHVPWDEKSHDSSIDALIAELKKHEYFICAGDLNAPDENILKIKEAGFNLANGGEHGWFCTSGKRFGTDKPNQNIDNILTSKNISIDQISAPKTGLNDQDHLPLLATLKIWR